MQIPYLGVLPQIHATVFVAEGAKIVGDVAVEQDSSIWFNAVLRGDLAPVRIGRGTNLQDGVIGHVNTDQPLLVGDNVTVGHGALIHGCTIHQGALIGMGAIVLNGAVIGEYSLIGAGSVVTENTVIPPYTLALGTPAKPVRPLTEDDLARMKANAESYAQKGREYSREIQRN